MGGEQVVAQGSECALFVIADTAGQIADLGYQAKARRDEPGRKGTLQHGVDS
jgi:hypothetical protein